MENVFNVKYNTRLDRLQIPKKGRIVRLFKFIQRHKFFSIIFTSFFVLSGMNFYLIYNFVKVLETI